MAEQRETGKRKKKKEKKETQNYSVSSFETSALRLRRLYWFSVNDNLAWDLSGHDLHPDLGPPPNF